MKSRYKILVFAFCCLPLALSAQIQSVQYWFDTDFAGRITQTAAGNTVQIAELQTAGISEGLHLVHIRAKDNTNWSVAHTQLFFKLSVSAQAAAINGYEYWVDTDFAGRQQGTLAGQAAVINELNFATLAEGLHVLHIRATDNRGRKSVAHSQLFYKNVEMNGNNQIVLYEYWADGNFTERISQNVSGGIVTINNLFENNTLATGLHTVSVRAKDAAGRWSPVHSQLFYNNELVPDGVNRISAYHYWYDNDYESRQSVILETPVTPHEMNPAYELPATLGIGKHAFHIQFRDLSGKWSVATTDTFKIKLIQNIDWEQIFEATYGDEPVTLTAATSSQLPVSYTSSDTDIATIENDVLTVLNAGTTTITAIQAGNPDYSEAIQIEKTLTVEKAPLTITANDAVRGFGQPNPEFVLSYNGFKNNEDVSVLDVLPTVDCAANETSPEGFYDIILSGGTDNNYAYTLIDGRLEVTVGTAINEISTNDISIYPNPVKDKLTINNEQLTIRDVKIVDVSGQTIYHSSFLVDNSIDVSSLPSGIYLVKIQIEKEVVIQRFVKK